MAHFIGQDIVLPSQIADILDVPYTDIIHLGSELKNITILSQMKHSDILSDIYSLGLSKLILVYNFYPEMNFYFIMKNRKALKIKYSEWSSSYNNRANGHISHRIFCIFEKFKIEGLKGKSMSVSVPSRFEILDL